MWKVVEGSRTMQPEEGLDEAEVTDTWLIV